MDAHLVNVLRHNYMLTTKTLGKWTNSCGGVETTFGLARVDKVLKHLQSILYERRLRHGKSSFTHGLLFSGESGEVILML